VQPTTDVDSPVGQFQTDNSTTAGAGAPATFETINPATSKVPDGNLVFGINQPWGHLRLNAILQQLELQDGALVSKDYFGYGGGFSGNVRPNWFGWPKDGFGFEAWAGSGLGRYANGTVGFQGLVTNFGAAPGTSLNLCGYGSVAGGAAAVTPLCAQFIRASTITAYGGQVNYAHYWLPNVRSTVVFGYQGEDVPGALVGLATASLTVNRAVWDAGINLIWSPVAFVNIGVEYNYGQRVTLSNIRGDENVLEGEFQVSF
jgi:hypothetical protein